MCRPPPRLVAVRAAPQVLVAVGAVGPGRDVEIARVGREVPDLRLGEELGIRREWDRRLVVHADARVQLLERGGQALHIVGVQGGSDVDVTRHDLNACQDGGIAADDDAADLVAGEDFEDPLRSERGRVRRHG